MTNQYTPPRRWPRLPVIAECRIDGLSDQAPARLTELSIGGGYVDTDAGFAVGDRVQFGTLLGGTDVTMVGRVIYTHPRIGFGFTFELNEMDRSMYEGVVEFLSREAGQA